MSIVRVDSWKACTCDNIELVCGVIIQMKGDLPNDVFIKTCRQFILHNNVTELKHILLDPLFLQVSPTNWFPTMPIMTTQDTKYRFDVLKRYYKVEVIKECNKTFNGHSLNVLPFCSTMFIDYFRSAYFYVPSYRYHRLRCTDKRGWVSIHFTHLQNFSVPTALIANISCSPRIRIMININSILPLIKN